MKLTLLQVRNDREGISEAIMTLEEEHGSKLRRQGRTGYVRVYIGKGKNREE